MGGRKSKKILDVRQKILCFELLLLVGTNFMIVLYGCLNVLILGLRNPMLVLVGLCQQLILHSRSQPGAARTFKIFLLKLLNQAL